MREQIVVPSRSRRKTPGPTAKYRAKRRRAEGVVAKKVREKCVDRDGYCRYQSGCDGPSEWAHLGEKKRARTRGMAPERRHSTEGSLMLCRYHHGLYDSGQMTITPMTDNGADGQLLFEPVVIA